MNTRCRPLYTIDAPGTFAIRLALTLTALALSACGGEGRSDAFGPGGGGGGTTTHAVTYTVSGTVAQAVITYRNAQGASVQLTAALPWTTGISANSGAALVLTARHTQTLGSLTATISADGTVLQSETESGASATASVTATCC